VKHGSLFSGIGGFDLAAEWMGWENLFNCEWEEFPRKVLKHHFPNAKQYGDIKEFNAATYAGRIDILTGGFPCQPYSTAGKRKGKEDERHLWPEMLRVVRECSPRWIVGENVRGLVNWNGGLVFEEVCADLEACGYSVQPFILPACAVNAPHRRDRVWFVAKNTDGNGWRSNEREEKTEIGEFRNISTGNNEPIQTHDYKTRNASDTDHKERDRGSSESKRERQEAKQRRDGVQRTAPRLSEIGNASDTDGKLLEHRNGERATGKRTDQEKRTQPLNGTRSWETFPTVPPVCGGDDGIPKELDGITFPKWRRESIKAYGNAIVPQVALRIFEAIQEYEKRT
jgi:DNA (cytosine-5)-methyltransferase 1